MMDGMYNAWGMGCGLGWIIGLLILVVVIGITVGALKSRKTSNSIKYNSPQDILKTRYAKGEISKVEYDEKRNHIS